MTKHALVRWDAGLHMVGETSTGHRLEMDDEAGARGFRPSELVMVSLGGCTGMDVISILRKKQQQVTSYEVDVTGETRPNHPMAYTDVLVEHRIEGNPLDPEAVRRAIELSATKYCPVTAVLATGIARVVHRYVVRNPQGEFRADVVVTGPGGANVAGLGHGGASAAGLAPAGASLAQPQPGGGSSVTELEHGGASLAQPQPGGGASVAELEHA
ncbi:MAG: OsmC family protein [Candidatus Limnocylindrales bacterium]